MKEYAPKSATELLRLIAANLDTCLNMANEMMAGKFAGGDLEGLPEDPDERQDTIALAVVTVVPTAVNGATKVTASEEDVYYAQQMFKIIWATDDLVRAGLLSWSDKKDEYGFPQCTINAEQIERGRKIFLEADK